MFNYILIESGLSGTFFKQEESNNRYFEIYKLSDEQSEGLIEILNSNKAILLVTANSQMDALRKFIEIYGNIFKAAGLPYYEKILPLKV